MINYYKNTMKLGIKSVILLKNNLILIRYYYPGYNKKDMRFKIK